METIRTQAVIIGSGPGGLSAALWCDELGIDHLVLESRSEPGGQLLWTHNEIDNYLGLPAANGRELLDHFLKQARRRNLRFRFGSRVVSFEPKQRRIQLEEGPDVIADAVVIATGISRRVPEAEGFERFGGKGVLESGKRDRHLASGKDAVVVGGGDAAFENALILSETAASVTLVHRRVQFTAREEFREPVLNHPKIYVRTGCVVSALGGDESLETVTLTDTETGLTEVIPADAIVFRIGVRPNSEIFKPVVETDPSGYIHVRYDCSTSVPGVYAVGDVANPVSPTVATAAGMGATAAKSMYSWLKRSPDIQFNA